MFLILKAIRAIIFHLFTVEVTIFICLYFPVFIDVVTFFSLSACLSFSLSFFHEANYVFIVLFLASQFVCSICQIQRSLQFSFTHTVFYQVVSLYCASPTLPIFSHVAFRLVVIKQNTFLLSHFSSVSVSIDYSFQSSFWNVIYPQLFAIISFLSSSKAITCSPVFKKTGLSTFPFIKNSVYYSFLFSCAITESCVSLSTFQNFWFFRFRLHF